MQQIEALKEKVAQISLEYLLKSVRENNQQNKSQIWLGIGSGTTIKYFLSILSQKFLDGSLPFSFVTVSSSVDSETTCRDLQLPIKQLEDLPEDKNLDYYIDGADEVDEQKRCLKGLGGASTREKLLRINSNQFYVLTDESKRVTNLCTKHPVVVEILPFAHKKTLERLQALNPTPTKIELRRGSGKMGYVLTDNHNYLVDVFFEKDLSNDFEFVALEKHIKVIPGVIETGLFSTPATVVFIASQERVDILQ